MGFIVLLLVLVLGCFHIVPISQMTGVFSRRGTPRALP